MRRRTDRLRAQRDALLAKRKADRERELTEFAKVGLESDGARAARGHTRQRVQDKAEKKPADAPMREAVAAALSAVPVEAEGDVCGARCGVSAVCVTVKACR